MAARRKPKPTLPEDYKNRDTFVFRGLTYRFNKGYGEWRLVGFKKPPFGVPDTIADGRAHTTSGLQVYWRASGATGPTPLAALEAWAKGLTALRRREARDAELEAKELWAEVARLERPSWKPRAKS